MTIAYVALGANLGDPLKALPEVIDVIGSVEGIKVTGRSRFYSTAPIDSSGPDYTNAVIRIETTIEPEALLQTLLRRNSELSPRNSGPPRKTPWGEQRVEIRARTSFR